MLALATACGGNKGASASPADADAEPVGETKQEPNEALADLRALAEQKSYEELLAKATEVEPTARDGEWESLLETAAVAYLTQLANDDDEGMEMAPVEAAERLVELYPFLAERKPFRKTRAETGIDAFRRCHNGYCRNMQGWRRDIDWSRAVHEYTKIDPEYSAFIAGKMVMTRLVGTTATGMFALAVEHNGEEVCADSDLEESVNAAKREGIWKEEVAQITKVCGE